MKTNTRPPKEIYDVLHAAESKGIDLPESVDKWWALETAINENPECQTCYKFGLNGCDEDHDYNIFKDIALLIEQDYDT